jgi:hypothetical protein
MGKQRILSRKGEAGPSTAGKRAQALAMYNKGKGFLIAANSLNSFVNTFPEAERFEIAGKCEQYKYVAIHLFCQSIEIILKGILLVNDFDKYKPFLSEKTYRYHQKHKDSSLKTLKMRLDMI